VGCYREVGRACTTCDTRKYWSQFGRQVLAYEMLLAAEATRKLRYSWVVRVRSDFKGVPRAKWPPWPHGWSTGQTGQADEASRAGEAGKAIPQVGGNTPPNKAASVFMGGLTGWSRRDERWVPYDWFAVVRRHLAERFFSVGFSFLPCQLRSANERYCTGATSWDWASPECILKVHLSLCVGGDAGIARLPPWVDSGGTALRMPAVRTSTTSSTASAVGAVVLGSPVDAPNTTADTAAAVARARAAATSFTAAAALQDPAEGGLNGGPKGGPEGCATTNHQRPTRLAQWELLIVSSMPAQYLLQGLRVATEAAASGGELPPEPLERRNLVASCLALQLPLYVTFDPDPSHPLPEELPPFLNAQDIFEAVPGLSLLLTPGHSPIEEFTALRGSWEPHGGSGKRTQCAYTHPH
jgi:hypothetical protein